MTVKVRLESTPPGARIVRGSDGVLLGTTPETIDMKMASLPIALRFEKDGFVATTREATLTSDTNLQVVLEAAPDRPTPAPRKRGSSRARAGSDDTPAVDEPAKL
jgi:hypothetical protein